MKKILVITMTLFLVICTIISIYLVYDMESKNKNLEKKIINIKNTIEKEEKLEKDNKETLNSLEENESFKVDELSIWKKAEEKLENASR